MSVGLFISFEGVDGAGKTTQIQRAHDFLRAKGLRSLVTREPGGTPVGLGIRELVLHGMSSFPSIAVTGGTDVVSASDDLYSRTEALLYAADRAEHVSRFIRPALDRGDIVLCDRYSDSSIAYQSGGRRLEEQEVDTLSRWAADGLSPDRTYLLDVDPAQSLARVNDEPDRMETAGEDFQQQVRAKFLKLAKQNPDRFLVIDASQSVNEVWQIIQADLEALTADMPVNIIDNLSDDYLDYGDEVDQEPEEHDDLDDNLDDDDSDDILDDGAQPIRLDQ